MELFEQSEDKLNTPPKKVKYEEQITVKISDLEKPDTIPTNDQESWQITIKELEQKNEEGYLINQELENDNRNLRQKTKS